MTIKIKPIFAWYDLWIGLFWDSTKRRLYILPLPCIGLVIQFKHVEKRATCKHQWMRLFDRYTLESDLICGRCGHVKELPAKDDPNFPQWVKSLHLFYLHPKITKDKSSP